jgi:hypothetical protein
MNINVKIMGTDRLKLTALILIIFEKKFSPVSLSEDIS